jgi:predicted nucleic acid-binding protein
LGIDRLRKFLQNHRQIALDTSVFIYQLEGNLRYVSLTDQVFSWLERPGNHAITSTITMTEILVQPYRDLNEQRVDEFYVRLSRYPNLEWIAPTLDIADLAAQFRALYRLRTPDALLAATAVHASATALITNDFVFERVPSFETAALDQFL